jgi:hypothetical protein
LKLLKIIAIRYFIQNSYKRGFITTKKKAVDQLQELYPSYFKNISDEVIMNGKRTSYLN